MPELNQKKNDGEAASRSYLAVTVGDKHPDEAVVGISQVGDPVALPASASHDVQKAKEFGVIGTINVPFEDDKLQIFTPPPPLLFICDIIRKCHG
jgi:hypothetical protein